MDPTILLVIPVAILIFKFLGNRNNIKPVQLKAVLANGGKIVDVRSSMEFKSGHVKNALNIQHDNIINGLKKKKISKETPIVLYCASGSRASVALSTLKSQGFTNAHNAGSKSRMEQLLKSI